MHQHIQPQAPGSLLPAHFPSKRISTVIRRVSWQRTLCRSAHKASSFVSHRLGGSGLLIGWHGNFFLFLLRFFFAFLSLVQICSGFMFKMCLFCSGLAVTNIYLNYKHTQSHQIHSVLHTAIQSRRHTHTHHAPHILSCRAGSLTRVNMNESMM